MLLAQWLQEAGHPGRHPHVMLSNVLKFEFGEDAYELHMMTGQTYQDNDLERMLALVHDEFEVHSADALIRGGALFIPVIEYPFIKGKPKMIVRPSVAAKGQEMPNLDELVDTLRERITLFNLTGQWVRYEKENL